MEKKTKIVILTIFIISLAVFIAALISYLKQPIIRYSEFEVYLTIGNYTGFNINNTALFFGTLMPGQSSTRFILLQNDGDTPVMFEMRSDGNVSSWMLFDKSIMLGPNQNYTLNVSVNVPIDAEFGNYYGKFRVYQVDVLEK